MQAAEHHDVVARVDEVEARVLRGDDAVSAVVALLDRAEQAAGAPLVDESERARLEELAQGRDRGGHWHSVVARRGEAAVGYAGLVLPGHDDRVGLARGDVAVDRGDPACEDVLLALLRAVDVLGRRHEARRLQIWLRHATGGDLHCAARAGYALDRRLGVLVRPLDGDDPAPRTPEGVRLDTFRESDADAVVEVLAAAYAGTADGGWTREHFDAKRGFDWFDPSDLLVARGAADEVLGIHWTKRRDDHTGEVYNLAVRPDAQGGQLGAVLLQAGLAHLRERGCRDVMLWVDLANERAVRLYTSQGFEVAWEDVALGRSLATRPAPLRRNVS